ncbi:hypothetical protein DMUE_2753 [Dictyocoela muelleri]|nr:hypothetical protein DMUE_2753 [Dictyocoela muelleri]
MLHLTTFIFLIECCHFINFNQYDNLIKYKDDLKLLSDRLFVSSEMLTDMITEYEVNITNEYPDLYEISKLYIDIIELCQTSIVKGRFFNRNYKILANFTNKKEKCEITSGIKNYKLKYSELMIKIKNIKIKDYFISDICKLYDNHITEFYHDLSEFVDKIKIDENSIILDEYKILENFNKKLVSFNEETAHLSKILEFSMEKKKNSGLIKLSKDIGSVNDSFISLFTEIAGLFLQNDKIKIEIEKLQVFEIFDATLKIQCAQANIERFNKFFYYPNKITNMIKTMNFQGRTLILGLNILKMKLERDENREIDEDENFGILNNIYKYIQYNDLVLKSIISNTIEFSSLKLVFLDKILEILRMNEDLNVCFSLILKNYSLLSIRYIYDQIPIVKAYVFSITKKINDVLTSENPQKATILVLNENFNYISKVIDQFKL